MVTPVWIGTRHFTPQSGIHKRHIDIHWMVGNLRGTDSAFNGSRSASATYGIEGSVVHQYVHEKDYSYANGNTYANRYGVTIEHAGGWLLPDGSRMKPSALTHETSAQLCADISRRWGMGKLIPGVNIFPHNHWVATMCSGSTDVAWIAARANEIMGLGGPVPAEVGGAHGGYYPAAAMYGTAWVVSAQTKLIKLGYNLGEWGADGKDGALTQAATISLQKRSGYLTVDGIFGPDTNTYADRVLNGAINTPATPRPVAPAFPLPSGHYFGPRYPLSNTRSVSGYYSHRDDLRRWGEQMRKRGWPINPDGLYGDQHGDIAYRFQLEKGLVPDRLIGPATWAAAWTAPIT